MASPYIAFKIIYKNQKNQLSYVIFIRWRSENHNRKWILQFVALQADQVVLRIVDSKIDPIGVPTMDK